MAIIIRYPNISRRPNEPKKKVPYIPIDLKGEEGVSWFHTFALLDSGADISVIPKDFAELIGVKIGEETDISNGLGGPVTIANSNMNIQLNGDHNIYHFNVPVQVVLDTDKGGFPPILGRDGFFSYFKIEFDHYNEKIKLTKNDVKDFRINN